MRWWAIGAVLGFFVGCLVSPGDMVEVERCIDGHKCVDDSCRSNAALACVREHVTRGCASDAKLRCSSAGCLQNTAESCAKEAALCKAGGLDADACEQRGQECVMRAGQKCADKRSECLTPAIRSCFNQEDALVLNLSQ